MQSLSYWIKHTQVDRDENDNRLACLVDWAGPGWYSLNDDNIYESGKAATYSRIYIH